jgi:hypothetical protein
MNSIGPSSPPPSASTQERRGCVAAWLLDPASDVRKNGLLLLLLLGRLGSPASDARPIGTVGCGGRARAS